MTLDHYRDIQHLYERYQALVADYDELQSRVRSLEECLFELIHLLQEDGTLRYRLHQLTLSTPQP